MDVYIYQEQTRKVRGEDTILLAPIGVLEGFDDEDAALEALIEAEPSYLGVELVIFTQEPQYITAAEPPPTKYVFQRRNGSGAVVEEEPEAEPEEEPEPEPVAVATKRRPAAKKPAASKKPPAKKRPATRAGTRAGAGGRKSPFTANAKSAE